MTDQRPTEIPDLLTPKFEPIEQLRAHEHVAEQLRRQINLHLIPAGDALPPERDLSAMFGVGRATVQAAVRLLEADRLVRTRRGRNGGTFVLEPSDELTREYLLVRVRRDRSRIEQAMTFRAFVERLSAAQAAKVRNDEELAQIRMACDQVGRADSVLQFLARDSILHLVIAHATHNAFLCDAVEQVRVVLNEAVTLLSFDADLWRDTRAEHEAVVEAIEAQDERRAEEAMGHHLDVTEQRVLTLLSSL